MPSRPNDHPQVGLVDVERAIREVAAAHCCNISVALVPPVKPDTPVLFWVKVMAEPRIVGRRTVRMPHQVCHRWPCVDCRHLEALMLRLVYKLDHDLDEVGHCPAEQATFLWDMGK